MRILLVLAVLPECVSEQTREPTIWQHPSPSIDPTALPLRDQHYVTSDPLAGYVYVCDPFMYRQDNAPGARRDGDWIDAAAGTFDITRKLMVAGDDLFTDAKLAITTSDDRRMIARNGLPFDVPTRTLPVATSDPADAYHSKPNP